MQYADRNFYVLEYRGDKISSELLNKFLTKASLEVRKNIFNRDITRFEQEVKMVTCTIAEILYDIENIENRINALVSNEGKIIASESIGDFTRNYANATSIAELKQEITNKKTEIKEELINYLGFTGLLYRGV